MPSRGRCRDPHRSPEVRAEKAADLTHIYVKEIHMTRHQTVTAALFGTALLVWTIVVPLSLAAALT